MNYLFHLYLSGPDEEILLGNFAGDFVKGPLHDVAPPSFRRGLQLHRHIDSFAQRHPLFIASMNRLPREIGLYRGILVDLYYDHFLTLLWDDFSDDPLGRFVARARRIVERNKEALPVRLQGLIPYIFDDFIPSYDSIEGIDHALKRLSRRVRRPNPLPLGGRELARHYAELRRDFVGFLPEIRNECRQFLLVPPPSRAQSSRQ